MKQGLAFLAILALAAAAIWYSLWPGAPIAQGLDLRGGMRVTLEPDPNKPGGANVGAGVMQEVRSVIENRVNSFGLSGAEVRLKGNNQILVLLPGARNPEEALKQLSTVAQLEFRHLNNVATGRNPGGRYKMNVINGDPTKGESDTYTFTDTAEGKEVPQDHVLKDSELILKGDALLPESRAQINPQNGQPYVSFSFKPDGAKVFGNFTTENVGEILAVVLDNKIISAPNINEAITEGHGQISGGFRNMAEARVLANLLNSGALPIPLRPAETQTVGATLGQESIQRSVMAGAVGLGLVLLFMVAYYWLPGVLACIALIIYAAITFSIFKGVKTGPNDYFLSPIVLDLPGITGFILSVGMAVDANILIFERLKEEIRAGKGLHAAVDAGFKRAFTSIFDSNVTTWIVCAILIWLGAPIIKGFAITLAIGVAVSMFTAITVTRTILHLMMETPLGRNPALYGLNVSWLSLGFPQWKEGAVLRVFEKRKVYLYGFSAIAGILSLGFLLASPFGYGLKPGIDFTGGTVVEAPFRDPNVTRDQVVSTLNKVGIHEATVSIAKSEVAWTKVDFEVTGADALTRSRVHDHLTTLRGFMDDGFKATLEKGALKGSAEFTQPVSQEEVQKALTTKTGPTDTAISASALKATATPEPHTGANAIPVALIQSQKLDPQKLRELKAELDKIGGGMVKPMYQESSIGPSVASEITFNAVSSLIVASLAIVLYLAFRFAIGGFINGLKFGAGAVIALIHDVGIVMGIFAIMGEVRGWQVDSLFVTAVLTVLGFSVHDTIVVYDRIRENLHHRRRGETFADVSDRSITQTFDRSINTSFTVVLVVAALVLFGGASIRLFNIALLMGIIIGTYSSIFVASPLVVLMERAAAARGGGTPAPARPAPPAGGRPGGGGGGPRRSPAAPAAPTRPTAAVTPVGEPDESADGGARRPSEGGTPAAPGTVRPQRRKRRM